jgi:aldose 1-epimerase
LHLRADGAECTIAPALGGSILRLAIGGLNLLRSAPAEVSDIHDVACFPLVPFANRVGEGRFVFDGVSAVLDVAGPGAPHALHGHGWQAAWSVARASAREAVLELDHAGPTSSRRGWPWPYRARQSIALAADGVAIELAIENRDTRPMSAGAGIHPYFIRSPESRIDAQASAMWRNDDSGLASECVPDDRLVRGRAWRIADLAPIDNWFAAADGEATIRDGVREVRVSGLPARGFHLYAPEDGDFFCVEPVSHAPNAFARGDFGPHDVIAPGATRCWRFSITGARVSQPQPHGSGMI